MTFIIGYFRQMVSWLRPAGRNVTTVPVQVQQDVQEARELVSW